MPAFKTMLESLQSESPTFIHWCTFRILRFWAQELTIKANLSVSIRKKRWSLQFFIPGQQLLKKKDCKLRKLQWLGKFSVTQAEKMQPYLEKPNLPSVIYAVVTVKLQFITVKCSVNTSIQLHNLPASAYPIYISYNKKECLQTSFSIQMHPSPFPKSHN